MNLRISFALTCLLAVQASAARAETATEDGALADLWLENALRQQRVQDIFGRYAAAPSSVVLGGAALIAVPMLELPASAKVAYMTSGALMLTAAIGLWAHSDPYEAQRWFGSFAGLGFVALGTGEALQCLEPDACGLSGLQQVIGATGAAFFLSMFIVTRIAPPPSPSALRLAVQGLGPAERHARVLDFLEQRDHTRRLGTYVVLPWGFVMGAGALAFAHTAATPEGEAFLYGAGSVLLALTTVGLLYELLRDTDAERFRAGERP